MVKREGAGWGGGALKLGDTRKKNYPRNYIHSEVWYEFTKFKPIDWQTAKCYLDLRKHLKWFGVDYSHNISFGTLFEEYLVSHNMPKSNIMYFDM